MTRSGAALHNVRVSRRAAKPPDSALQSAIAPRNFTVGLDERVRGLAGPPAYSSRKRRFATLNELIAAHNRFYPIEANLPIDVTTGRVIDRSGSWPHPEATWVELVARAREEGREDED